MRATCCWPVIIVVLIGSVQSGWGESRKPDSGTFVVRGEIAGLKAEEPPHADYAIVSIDLKLRFINDGAVPILLLKQKAPICPGVTITRNAGSASGDNILYEEYRGPSISGSQEWELYRRDLDQAEPPGNLVQIIKPGEEWLMTVGGAIHPPIKLELYWAGLPPASWKLLKESSPVWIRVQCEMWPVNVERDPYSPRLRLGHALQKRWRKFGKLPLAPIESEPIELELRDY